MHCCSEITKAHIWIFLVCCLGDDQSWIVHLNSYLYIAFTSDWLLLAKFETFQSQFRAQLCFSLQYTFRYDLAIPKVDMTYQSVEKWLSRNFLTFCRGLMKILNICHLLTNVATQWFHSCCPPDMSYMSSFDLSAINLSDVHRFPLPFFNHSVCLCYFGGRGKKTCSSFAKDALITSLSAIPTQLRLGFPTNSTALSAISVSPNLSLWSESTLKGIRWLSLLGTLSSAQSIVLQSEPSDATAPSPSCNRLGYCRISSGIPFMTQE